MSSSAPAGADPDDVTTAANAGSLADQHITGTEETGTFITDKPPAADTPVHGSGNDGVDTAGAEADRSGQ
jgi:hypothetical protein